MGWLLSVYLSTLVAVDHHIAISDYICHLGAVRAVDGDHFEVGSESVAVGVRVGEQSPLQNAVSGWTHTRHKVTWRESRLLGVGEIVLAVAIKHYLANLDERVVLLADNFGGVKDVPLVVGHICFRDSLHAQLPLCSLPLVYVSHQVPKCVIRVFEQGLRLAIREVFNARQCSDVYLDPEGISVFVFPPKRVSSILMHMSKPIRSSSVAEIDHILVGALPRIGNEVPQIVRVLEVCLWVLLA